MDEDKITLIIITYLLILVMAVVNIMPLVLIMKFDAWWVLYSYLVFIPATIGGYICIKGLWRLK